MCQRGLPRGQYYHAPFFAMAVFNFIGPIFGLPFVTGSLPHSPQLSAQLLLIDGEDTTQNGTDAVQVSKDFEYYVYSAMRIQCYTEEHDSLVRLASVFIALWPVGVPVLFFVLLDRAQVRSSERKSKRGRPRAS